VWSFERMACDLILIRRLLDGDWDEDMVVIPPGHQVVMTYDGSVLDCQEAVPIA
jgi:hypothetical protein